MTQKERVYSMLKNAGARGVSSKTFIESYLPRAAARIQELKDEGVPITTVREGKYVRYFVGDRAEGRGQAAGQSTPVNGQPAEATLSSVSGERSVPSNFDFDADWAA